MIESSTTTAAATSSNSRFFVLSLHHFFLIFKRKKKWKKIVRYNRKTSKMQIYKVKRPGQSEMDPMQMIFSAFLSPYFPPFPAPASVWISH